MYLLIGDLLCFGRNYRKYSVFDKKEYGCRDIVFVDVGWFVEWCVVICLFVYDLV